jgi:hypothetical protein
LRFEVGKLPARNEEQRSDRGGLDAELRTDHVVVLPSSSSTMQPLERRTAGEARGSCPLSEYGRLVGPKPA